MKLLLAALLALVPPIPAPSAPPAPPAIIVTPPSDSFDIYLVEWHGDHFHVDTVGQFQKALPKCKKVNVSMFDQKDGGVMIAFNCFL